MRSFYFNAKPTTDLVSHPTGYDRVYDAADRAEYHAPEATDGIFAVTNDACQAYVVEGNIIGVKAGYANYRGYRCHVEGNETIAATSSGYITLRWDNTETVRAFVLALTPTLVDTEVIHDLPLAQVTVEGGAVTAIVDKREWVQWTRLPPYYPPDSDAVPIALWRYIIGLPMTEDERSQVESSPELMAMYNNSKLTAAGRYGRKFEAHCSMTYKSYHGSNITDTTSGRFVFNVPKYDPLGMLGEDKSTFTIPASVHRLRVQIYGILCHIELGSGATLSIKRGDTTLLSFPSKYRSGPATESMSYDYQTLVQYVDVTPGDQIYFYGAVYSGSSGAACSQIDDISIEVVE